MSWEKRQKETAFGFPLASLPDINRSSGVTERRAENCSVTEQKCLYVSVTDFRCTTLPLQTSFKCAEPAGLNPQAHSADELEELFRNLSSIPFGVDKGDPFTFYEIVRVETLDDGAKVLKMKDI